MNKLLFALVFAFSLIFGVPLCCAQSVVPAEVKPIPATEPNQAEAQDSDEGKDGDKKSESKKQDKRESGKKSDEKKPSAKSDSSAEPSKNGADNDSSVEPQENEESESPPQKGEDSEEKDKDDSDKQEQDENSRPKFSLRDSIFGSNSAAEEAYSKRSDDFVSVFKPVIASAAMSTVKVMSGRRQLALGIVLDTDGFILTKASELRGTLTCEFADGRKLPATVFGVHPETDLAMLKVEIDKVKLNPIHWSDGDSPVVGQWLATPNGQKTMLDVGIVGVNTRVIPASSPFIGIGPPRIPSESAGAKIDSVVANSPADDADLMVGDNITHIDDVEIKDWDALRKTLGQYDVNDRITLTLIRAGKKLKIKLTLAERDKISPQNERSNQQNSMGSVLSRRRKDFPNAFQHDSMLTSTTCGGPIVNIDGQVVGVNIARAGRVDSLALPVQTVLPVIALLKTGELAPDIVNKERLVSIDKELAELESKLADLPEKKNSLETQYQVEKAKQEELEKILNDVQDRLKVIELKSKNFGMELDSVKNELKSIEKIRQRLEADRKYLSSGLR